MKKGHKTPIHIKRLNGARAWHGGAWKVAYADFVTAMMAFFLLLWLLSSVDEPTLEGLAEFFTPTVGIRDSMGIGFEGGVTANEEGTKRSDRSPPGIVVGTEQKGTDSTEAKDSLIESDKDAKLFEQAEEAMKKAFESDPNLRDLSENVVMEQTPEGLKIDLMDSDKNPMFLPGGTQLSPHGRRILTRMVPVIEAMPNYIAIGGHTDASKMTARGSSYSNWELSADRANAARRFLSRQGVQKQRSRKVTGYADTDLVDKQNPTSSKNRRITVILLRGDYLDLNESQMPATRDLLSAPSARPPELKEVEEIQEETAPKPPVIVPNLIPQSSDAILPGQGQLPVDALKSVPNNAPGIVAPADAVINPTVKPSKQDRRLLRADPSEFMDDTPDEGE